MFHLILTQILVYFIHKHGLKNDFIRNVNYILHQNMGQFI